VKDEVGKGLDSLPVDATQDDIRQTVNTLMDHFINKSLRDYHEGATRMENECWAQNVFMQKKVCWFICHAFFPLFNISYCQFFR